jgi:hypothetical protein
MLMHEHVDFGPVHATLAFATLQMEQQRRWGSEALSALF